MPFVECTVQELFGLPDKDYKTIHEKVRFAVRVKRLRELLDLDHDAISLRYLDYPVDLLQNMERAGLTCKLELYPHLIALLEKECEASGKSLSDIPPIRTRTLIAHSDIIHDN